MVIEEQSPGAVGEVGNWKSEKPTWNHRKRLPGMCHCIPVSSLQLSLYNPEPGNLLMALKMNTHFGEAANMFLFVRWESKYPPDSLTQEFGGSNEVVKKHYS